MGMTERQAEALRLQREGLTRAEIGKRLGVRVSGVKNLLERARKWENADSALAAGAAAIGADTPPRLVWTKQHPDGTVTHSVLHSAEKEQQSPEEITEALRDGLKSCPKAKPVSKTATIAENQAAIFPVADLHIGLLADEEEVGHDWDTKISAKVLEDTFGRLVANTPDASVAVLAQLGDLMHTDDQTNVTPQSKHQLDVDSRYFLVLRRAVAAMKWCIDTLRQKYPKVIYRGCRGNHDITSHYAVTIALAEHYRDCGDVEIIDSAGEFFCYTFGSNMVLLCHGDKTKPDRLVHFAAAQWPEIWGQTRHRLALTGHVHHETRREIGGMTFESVGTIIPRDAYAYNHAFTGKRGLFSITLDHDSGEISRARVAV